MLLDLRFPMGLLFVALGALLAGYGLLGDQAVYAASLGINVNLWTGLGILVFGALMLAGGGGDEGQKSEARRATDDRQKPEEDKLHRWPCLALASASGFYCLALALTPHGPSPSRLPPCKTTCYPSKVGPGRALSVCESGGTGRRAGLRIQ